MSPLANEEDLLPEAKRSTRARARKRPAPRDATVPPAPPRVVIEAVSPEIDSGRFPVKRTVGEQVDVAADIHGDGHDALAAVLKFRPVTSDGEPAPWSEVAMEEVVNDRWQGSFMVESLCPYEYTIEAWVDRFRTWQRWLRRRIGAGQDVEVDLEAGADLVEETARRAKGADGKVLSAWAAAMRPGSRKATAAQRAESAFDVAGSALMDRYSDRRPSCTYDRILRVSVDRERARFSSWYEMFPRSASSEPGRHGTFKDCQKRLGYVAGMGFDVLYLPPIHPTGLSFRKGRNNAAEAAPGDVGSPWGIGSQQGGHDAVHPDLGTLDDFRSLLRAAKRHGIEVALDLALQCSPDHPWVRDHPEWFRHRPDGSIQYAENPPKKYQDIYPLDFETPGWRDLWAEILRVVEFWTAQGVRIFRVDNPHTKPYAFWEWLIDATRRRNPDLIFLAEAFTRPKVMYRLAKLGFSQSYTYFAWRNTSSEIRDYFTELTRSEVREYFRPNLWPNTPDILTEHMQAGGRPAFVARHVLAATLGASYGVYGPAWELCENRPLVPGREEYLDSEKYEVRHWDIDSENSLAPVIARVNRIRRENAALQSDRGLRFHEVSNDQLIAYSKATPDLSNIIVTVVNLDPHYRQSGFVDLPLNDMGLDRGQPFQMHDLLGEGRYIWNGPSNYVELDPHVVPAHIFRVRRRLRTERDFDYYL